MGDGQTFVRFEPSDRDLHIFAGIQLQNEATSFLDQWNMQQAAFYGFMKSVTTEILQVPHTRNEFDFLRSKMNFFSYEFKLRMMEELCKRTKAARGMDSIDLKKMADAMLVRDVSMLLLGKSSKDDQVVEIMTQSQVNDVGL
jgi:hypothetical protein